MRKVVAECPGSCGEFIQGFINEKKMLVSYPVDIYSRVALEFKDSANKNLSPKVKEALKKTCEYLNISPAYLEKVNCEVVTKLPIGKGMASSTADIGAAVMAMGALFDYQMNTQEIASIALSIEPTDSVIFPAITLFDYISGEYSEELGSPPPIDVVVLEGHGIVDTLAFNQKDYKDIVWQNKEVLEKAFVLLKEGIAEKDYVKLGEATLLSARANQSILPKLYLEDVVETAFALNAGGVNVAHSGTVLGVFFDSHICDSEKLAAKFQEKHWKMHFKNVYLTKMVQGGARLI